MIDADPKARPTIQEVLDHPFFMTPAEGLNYIRDVFESKRHDYRFKQSLDNSFSRMSLKDRNWRCLLSKDVSTHLDDGLQVPYNGRSFYQLIRAIRNKVGV